MFMVNDAEAKHWHDRGMNLYWISTELGMIGSEVRRTRKAIDNF
jgi:hypothetical protein